MKLVLKDKAIQALRILVLLGGGAVLSCGVWVALNLKVLSPVPIWMGNVLIVIVVTTFIAVTPLE